MKDLRNSYGYTGCHTHPEIEYTYKTLVPAGSLLTGAGLTAGMSEIGS